MKYLISLIIIIGFILDKLSKYLVVRYVPIGSRLEVIPDIFYINHQYNDGLVFGMLSSLRNNNNFKNYILVSISLFALSVIIKTLYDFYKKYIIIDDKEQNKKIIIRNILINLSLIISGAIGNTSDKLFGYLYYGKVQLFFFKVIDFVNIGWKSHRFAIFNVADVLITIGVCISATIILKNKKIINDIDDWNK